MLSQLVRSQPVHSQLGLPQVALSQLVLSLLTELARMLSLEEMSSAMAALARASAGISAHTDIEHVLASFDLGLVLDGYFPIVVEQAIFSSTLGVAGTPDAIFYRPPGANREEHLLFTDLKVSRALDPLATSKSPSDRFQYVFDGIASGSIADTVYHRAGMQLNLYHKLFIQGGYVQAVRRHYDVATDAPCPVQLTIINLSPDPLDAPSRTLQSLAYPVVSELTRRLLDSWHSAQGCLLITTIVVLAMYSSLILESHTCVTLTSYLLYIHAHTFGLGIGRVDLLRGSLIQANAKQILASLPSDVAAADTILSILLPTLKSGRKLLKDDRVMSTTTLQKFLCPWYVTVRKTTDDLFAVCVCVETITTRAMKLQAQAESHRNSRREWLSGFEIRLSRGCLWMLWN